MVISKFFAKKRDLSGQHNNCEVDNKHNRRLRNPKQNIIKPRPRNPKQNKIKPRPIIIKFVQDGGFF